MLPSGALWRLQMACFQVPCRQHLCTAALPTTRVLSCCGKTQSSCFLLSSKGMNSSEEQELWRSLSITMCLLSTHPNLKQQWGIKIPLPGQCNLPFECWSFRGLIWRSPSSLSVLQLLYASRNQKGQGSKMNMDSIRGDPVHYRFLSSAAQEELEVIHSIIRKDDLAAAKTACPTTQHRATGSSDKFPRMWITFLRSSFPSTLKPFRIAGTDWKKGSEELSYGLGWNCVRHWRF